MDNHFDDDEYLLRAVYPESKRPEFWKNGRLSSAALKDKRGLSVDRTFDREKEDAVYSMRQRFCGHIVSFSVPDCISADAYLKYCPSDSNPYHSEIHGSETQVELDDIQALKLARSAVIEPE